MLALRFTAWHLEYSAGRGLRLATVDDQKRCATARRKHDSHSVGARIQKLDVGTRMYVRTLAEDANDLKTYSVVTSIGVAASDDGDHCEKYCTLRILSARLDPPQPARPFGFDGAIKFGQFTVAPVDQIIHARLARLLQAAMLNGVVCESTDNQT